MKIKLLVLSGALALLTGCVNGTPETGGGPQETVYEDVGRNGVGENCRVVSDPVPTRNPGESHFAVFCGEWESSSGAVTRASEGGDVGPASSLWYRSVDRRMICDDGEATTILSDNVSARIYDCRLKQGGWPMVAVTLNIDGSAYLATGIPAAIKPLEVTIGLLSGRISPTGVRSSTSNSRAIARIEAQLGNRQFSAGDMDAFRKLMDVASYYNSIGNFASSEAYYRQALDLLERTNGPDSPTLADPMMRMALAMSNQGKFEEAGLLLDRAAGLAQGDYDPLTQPRISLFRAMHLLHMKRCTEALEEVRYGQARLVDIANQGGRGADAAVLTGSRAEAQVELALSRAIEGAIHLCLNDLDAAERAADQAIRVLTASDVAPREWRPIFLSLKSEVLRRRESYSSGQSVLNRAIRERDRLFDPGRPQALDYLNLGEIRAEDGRRDEALDAYRRGIAILKAQNDGVILDQILPYLDILAQMAKANPAMAATYHQEMFEAGQIVRSTVTSSTIAETAARLASGNQAVSGLIREMQDVDRRMKDLTLALDAAQARVDAVDRRDEIEAMRVEREALRQRRTELEQQVQAAAPAFNQLIARPVELDRVLPVLRGNEVLVQILLGSNRSVAFLVTARGVTPAFIDVGAYEAGEAVKVLHKGVVIGEDQILHPFDTSVAHQLYQLFLAPFEADLAGAEHLAVVPSGPLLSLPFSMLVRREASRDTPYKDVAWVAKDLSVSSSPSVRSFVDLRDTAKASAATKPFIGFGDFEVPAATREVPETVRAACMRRLMWMARNAPRLPETEDELRAVANVLNAGNDAVRTGTAFTENNVRTSDLSGYRIVHFATHGIMPADVGCAVEPALVTSVGAAGDTGDPASDGLLLSSEILDLHLDADIVVLSACNTGGGDGTGGESLSGLARSFFYSGARALLVSHWYVDSDATRDLMSDMFSTLSQNGAVSKAEALRQARMEILERAGRDRPDYWAHPAFWAGFTLVGEGSKPGL